MPILRPEIQKALRAAGLTKEVSEVPLSDKLQIAGLGIESVLETLNSLLSSSNEVVRRQAAETALKLHGVLRDQEPPPPSITIIIQDPSRTHEVNPILIPRTQSPKKELKETIQ